MPDTTGLRRYDLFGWDYEACADYHAIESFGGEKTTCFVLAPQTA